MYYKCKKKGWVSLGYCLFCNKQQGRMLSFWSRCRVINLKKVSNIEWQKQFKSVYKNFTIDLISK